MALDALGRTLVAWFGPKAGEAGEPPLPAPLYFVHNAGAEGAVRIYDDGTPQGRAAYLFTSAADAQEWAAARAPHFTDTGALRALEIGGLFTLPEFERWADAFDPPVERVMLNPPPMPVAGKPIPVLRTEMLLERARDHARSSRGGAA